MTSTSHPSTSPWHLAQRAARLNPSVIREILKVTEQPGILSLAGGLPSPDAFPIEAMREASERVLRDHPREALQYAASEGYGPLRDWVAEHLKTQGLAVQASQVLITTGSQQGLDLVAKVLVDPGAPVAVETPTYLGALQAFSPFEPRFIPVDSDEQGARPESLRSLSMHAPAGRFFYVLPNYQNPTGRVMGEARRVALVEAAEQCGVPLVEDNPYGDLWYDAPPPPALSGRWAEGSVYLGSFSKVLAPGLRLGYVVAPPALYPKLLQAKQAADLHTPGYNQRIVHAVIADGFLDRHLPTVRARYKAQRDAMQQALTRHLPAGTRWQPPQGGMFFWLTLPDGCDALALLPQAVEAGVAYVPGAAFYADHADTRTLRLSFVTLSPEQIDAAVALLGGVLRRHLER
ncbi:aminotransferase-like domain-containing protein [Leptothrix discophora]|uniref:PLP-dependent aminotransferase family protein n=1 Tax=Leptothrix discophora TaxID=89 RepID=A0ABT9G487_LEPDI|nr:PLP-dependent aminotransferase family protein [Leptothrix discophora]MDP4301306.1 PLP-dependent aminotransferase family protein [Leptothrix discophora]